MEMDRRRTDRRQSPQTEVTIPSLSEIIAILIKRRVLITLLLFAPILAGGVYLKTKPNTYRATATVLIENQQFNLADFQDVLGDVKFDNLTVPTQVQVIASANLAQETIATLGLTLDERERVTLVAPALALERLNNEGMSYALTQAFLSNLQVKQQGASRVIEISYSSHDPQMAATIANGHAKQYVYSQIAVKKQQAKMLNDWIDKQIVGLREESLRKSRAVQRFRAESGMVLGRNSQELIYQQISDIAAQLTPIETKELDLKARQEMLRARDGSAMTDIVDSALVQNLKAQASAASQKLEALRSDLGENHPEIVALRKQIAQINSDLAREVGSIKISIENELKTVTKQKEMLQAKLSELQQKADVSQENQITLQSLQLEESASSKLLDSFLARSEEIKSQIDFTRPDVRIVSLADVPNNPAGSRRLVLMAMIGMFSVVFALGTVLLLELVDDGIRNREDVRRHLNLKLLGCLPREKNPIKSILEKARSPFAEEIKRLYIHLSAMPEAKTLLFTSALHDEGKSTIAISLAYYMTTIGKRVLIIDADTLSPTLAGVTMVAQAPGFYELLSGTGQIKEVIKRDKVGLSIIPQGSDVGFSSDLLLSGPFEKILSALRDHYDYILIDSAPVLLSSDGEVLSRLVDQSILVVHWSKTTMKNLKNAAHILRQFSRTTPCVILNRLSVADLKET